MFSFSFLSSDIWWFAKIKSMLKWFAISVVSETCFGILDKSSQTQQNVCVVPMHGNLFWLICLNIFSFINLHYYSFSSFHCYSLVLFIMLHALNTKCQALYYVIRVFHLAFTKYSSHLTFTKAVWRRQYHCVRAQSCPTFCDPMDYSKTDSSVRGIFQARILEWKLPFPPPRSLSHLGIELESPALAGRFFTPVSPGKLRQYHYYLANEQTGVQEDLESCWERFYGLLCTTGSGARVQAQVCFKGPHCADCASGVLQGLSCQHRTAFTTGAFDLPRWGWEESPNKGPLHGLRDT